MPFAVLTGAPLAKSKKFRKLLPPTEHALESSAFVVTTNVPSDSCGSVFARSPVAGKSTNQPLLLAKFTGCGLVSLRVTLFVAHRVEPAGQGEVLRVCCTKVLPPARGLPTPLAPKPSLIA